MATQKLVQSNLVERVLNHIDRGFIHGVQGTSGPEVLDDLKVALQSILAGVAPDEALGIFRRAHRSRDALLDEAAIVADDCRRKGHSWAVTCDFVNRYLELRGHREVSNPRIQQIYKSRKRELEQRQNMISLRDRAAKGNVRGLVIR